MDVLQTADLLRPVLADLATVMDGISPDRLADPTPCTDYDVARLRNHVLGWLTTFAAGYADPGGQAPPLDLDTYAAPSDPAAQVRAAAAQLDDALRAGAGERPLQLGESAMPGGMALSMVLWEYQMHGWDLARATGQPWQPPVAATTASLDFAPTMLTPDYQGQGKTFGPPVTVAADAPPLEQLLGISGRDPAWRPPGA